MPSQGAVLGLGPCDDAGVVGIEVSVRVIQPFPARLSEEARAAPSTAPSTALIRTAVEQAQSWAWGLLRPHPSPATEPCKWDL